MNIYLIFVKEWELFNFNSLMLGRTAIMALTNLSLKRLNSQFSRPQKLVKRGLKVLVFTILAQLLWLCQHVLRTNTYWLLKQFRQNDTRYFGICSHMGNIFLWPRVIVNVILDGEVCNVELDSSSSSSWTSSWTRSWTQSPGRAWTSSWTSNCNSN